MIKDIELELAQNTEPKELRAKISQNVHSNQHPWGRTDRSTPQSRGRTVGSTTGMLVTVNILADLGRFWQKKTIWENTIFLPRSAKLFSATNIPGVEPTVLPPL